MVKPGDANVKAEDGEEKRFSWFNKKKNQGRIGNHLAKRTELELPELLRGVEFSIAKNGPKLYLKVLKNATVHINNTQKFCRHKGMSETRKIGNLHPNQTG